MQLQATTILAEVSPAGWGATGLGVAACIGFALARRAWRGRRIDDHPLCRKCGYDLMGLPASCEKCPECGRTITGAATRRIGHREHRRGLLTAGLLVALVSVLGLGGMGYIRAKQVDLQKLKPFWWLMREADGANVAAHNAAVRELYARVNHGRISDSQMAQLVDYALKIQADHGRAWDESWTDVLVLAHQRKRIAPETFQQFIRQSVVVDFEINPKVRKGAPFPWRVVINRRGAWGDAQLDVLSIELDGTNPGPRDNPFPQNQVSNAESGPFEDWLVPADNATLAGMLLGDDVAKLRITVVVNMSPGAIARTTLSIEHPWQLVTQQSVQAAPDPRLEAALKKSIIVDWSEGSGFALDIKNPPPKSLAFDVFMRVAPTTPQGLGEPDPTRDQFYGRFVWDARLGTMLGSFIPRGAGFAGMWQPHSLVFRASAATAEAHVGILENWEGEVVVPIVWPSANPTTLPSGAE